LREKLTAVGSSQMSCHGQKLAIHTEEDSCQPSRVTIIFRGQHQV
jgi:hypothetical protein